MTNLEITRLCAEAMGHSTPHEVRGKMMLANSTIYDPLHDDAQAMALVKKCVLGLAWSGYWSVYEQGNGAIGSHIDLNRAICECCAKMMLAKKGASNDATIEGKAR